MRKPTPIQAARRLKMVEFLEKLKPSKFRFSCVITGSVKDAQHASCNTVGCVIGWTPVVFPNVIRWNVDVYGNADWFQPFLYCGRPAQRNNFPILGRKLFGDSNASFAPSDDCHEDATPKQVAAYLRNHWKLPKRNEKNRQSADKTR